MANENKEQQSNRQGRQQGSADSSSPRQPNQQGNRDRQQWDRDLTKPERGKQSSGSEPERGSQQSGSQHGGGQQADRNNPPQGKPRQDQKGGQNR